MHDAVRRYDITMLKSLVAGGAPLTEIDEKACTPLHLAVDGPADAVLEMLTILLSSDEEEISEILDLLKNETRYLVVARLLISERL